MSNPEKIDSELAERIRVVSGQQSFSFPIWFGTIAVGVRVGKGSPPHSHLVGQTTIEVLLVTDKDIFPLSKVI